MTAEELLCYVICGSVALFALSVAGGIFIGNWMENWK